jgi:hypothetical protein
MHADPFVAAAAQENASNLARSILYDVACTVEPASFCAITFDDKSPSNNDRCCRERFRIPGFPK